MAIEDTGLFKALASGETSLTELTKNDDIRASIDGVIDRNEAMVVRLIKNDMGLKQILRELIQEGYMCGFLTGARHASEDTGEDDTQGHKFG